MLLKLWNNVVKLDNQLFFNENKDKKVLIGGKTTMAEIKRACTHSDSFVADLLEQ